MYWFGIPSNDFNVPAVCVACGAPAAPLGQGGDAAVLTTAWSTTSPMAGTGSTLTQSAKASFPLCPACTAARAASTARAEAREKDLPHKWWVRALILAAVVCLALDIYLPPSGQLGPWAGVAVAALVAGLVLRNVMRKRFDREHSASDDELLRLALINDAVVLREEIAFNSSTPPYSVTFNNGLFAQAFHEANPLFPSR